jgi:hypothetical protein
MASSADIGTLRNATISANSNRSQIVDPYIFADPTVVTNLKAPRKLDANSRLYQDPLSDLGAESPED